MIIVNVNNSQRILLVVESRHYLNKKWKFVLQQIFLVVIFWFVDLLTTFLIGLKEYSDGKD